MTWQNIQFTVISCLLLTGRRYIIKVQPPRYSGRDLVSNYSCCLQFSTGMSWGKKYSNSENNSCLEHNSLSSGFHLFSIRQFLIVWCIIRNDPSGVSDILLGKGCTSQDTEDRDRSVTWTRTHWTLYSKSLSRLQECLYSWIVTRRKNKNLAWQRANYTIPEISLLFGSMNSILVTIHGQ